MVYVEAPPEWLEAARREKEATAAAALIASGPPPLDHVASKPVSLDLTPAQPTWLTSYRWLLLTGVLAFAATAAVVSWLMNALPARSNPPSSSVSVASRATEQAEAPVEADQTELPPDEAKEDSSTSPTTSDSPSSAVSRTAEAADGKDLPSVHAADQKPEAAPAEKTGDSKESDSEPGQAVPPQTNEKDAEGGTTSNTEAAVQTADPAAEKVSAGEIRKLAPVPVDAAVRLTDRIPELALTDMPLGKACDLLSSISSVPITLDVDAMRQLEVMSHDAVSLHLTATTAGKALQMIATENRLTMTVEAGQVLLTSPADYREALRTVRYTVSDLVADDKTSIDELADMIRRFVAPESWQAGGGAIEPDGGVLVIVQTGDVHYQVVDFCEKLRLARQKPLRSRANPERFSLATRTARAEKLLAQPVTANFHEPTPLNEIAAYLAAAAPCDILIDRMALNTAETCDRVDGVVVAQEKPLGVVLRELLPPLGLMYRVVDAQTLQITSKEVLDERMELEFYSVKPLLVKGLAPAALVERVKSEKTTGEWIDAGGSGQIYFDPPSGSLLVLQSQPAQQAIQRLLAKP